MFYGGGDNISYMMLRLAANTTTVCSVQQGRLYSLIDLRIWFYLVKDKAF